MAVKQLVYSVYIYVYAYNEYIIHEYQGYTVRCQIHCICDETLLDNNSHWVGHRGPNSSNVREFGE